MENKTVKEVTKSALVSELAIRGETTEAEAKRNLDLLSETIMSLLEDNDKVILGNLGKIVKGKTKARVGRNPRTGEPIDIPEKIKLSYRPSKEIKDRMEEVK